MVILKTIGGQIYYLDTRNKKFWGGQFAEPLSFSSAKCIAGEMGLINLSDGRTILTSRIQQYTVV